MDPAEGGSIEQDPPYECYLPASGYPLPTRGVALRRGCWRRSRRPAFWNRLSAHRQPTLNRPARANDPAFGVLFNRLVFRPLAAEPLENRQVSLVAFIREHLVSLGRRVRDRDREWLCVGLRIADRRLPAQDVGLDARNPLDDLELGAGVDRGAGRSELPLKLVVSITSVLPSQRPRESPMYERTPSPTCLRPSSGITRASWIISAMITA